MLEFTRDARRSTEDQPVLTTRRTMEMEGLSLDVHVLKHLLRPRERWDEVVGFEIPQDDTFERARLMGRRTQVAEGIWIALQRLSPAAPLAAVGRLSAALLKDEIHWVRSRGKPWTKEALYNLFVGDELASDGGSESGWPLDLVPEDDRDEASRRWAPPHSPFGQWVLWAMLEDATRPLSAGELALAANLKRLAKDTKLVELLEFVRTARDRSSLENHARHALDQLERERPGLRAAYRTAIARAVAEAGTTPRHCVYDRDSARGSECYIDEHGITVCQSRERDGTYRIRTAYRVRTGRTPQERRLEAAEAAAFRRRIQPTKAVKDFTKSRAAIQERFTEERWLLID